MLKLSLICPCFQINNFTLTRGDLLINGFIGTHVKQKLNALILHRLKIIYWNIFHRRGGDVQAQVNKIKVALVSLPHTG